MLNTNIQIVQKNHRLTAVQTLWPGDRLVKASGAVGFSGGLALSDRNSRIYCGAPLSRI